MLLTEPAPAKLNLYLHVLGRRQDGYHLLDSLVIFVDIADYVTLLPTRPFVLSIDGPFCAPLLAESVTSNSIWNATLMLAKRLGRCPAVGWHLHKVLPVASGIAGGSSDAMACLRLLAKFWQIPFDDPILSDVAQSLGADGLICLRPRSWFVGSIRERLIPSPQLPIFFLVLVNPGDLMTTSSIFQRFDGPFSEPEQFIIPPTGDIWTWVDLLAQRRNDLTQTAIKQQPIIADVIRALEHTSGCLLARLSGSGATCFGLYEKHSNASQAAMIIKKTHRNWWVKNVSVRNEPDDTYIHPILS